jgi:hypothetical protein
MVVHLGALGVVTRVTLRLVPRFDIRQDLYLGLDFATAMANFDAIMSASYSVSLFTAWQGDVIDQIWRKSLPAEIGDVPPATWYGATCATSAMHPIASVNADPCTTRMGVVRDGICVCPTSNSSLRPVTAKNSRRSTLWIVAMRWRHSRPSSQFSI